MTIPYDTRPLAPASVPAALTTLRVRGMRVSATRRLMLEALFAAEGPVTAEALAARGLDLASVYRNLDTLEATGLVRHFHRAGGPGLYALTGRHEAGYATCEACGAHVGLDPAAVERLADALRAACGYEARLAHFPIVGRCPGCDHHQEAFHAHP
jgi:Fe2+ or Zn2+ uptake regulation protein